MKHLLLFLLIILISTFSASAQEENLQAKIDSLLGDMVHPELVEQYRQAAETGDIDAKFNLANCYFFGKGVTQNSAEAVRLYIDAANAGNKLAMNILCACYQMGEGVALDEEEALRWGQLAENSDDSSTDIDEDKNHNFTNACVWQIINNGNLRAFEAYIDYVLMFDRYDKALPYCLILAENGNVTYQYAAGICYIALENYTEAIKWLRTAAENGENTARYMLGKLYHDGEFVEKNNDEVVKWWTMAAEAGDDVTQYYLGNYYYDENEGNQDVEQAIKWWTMAAQQGVINAQERLKELGIEVEKKENRSIEIIDGAIIETNY